MIHAFHLQFYNHSTSCVKPCFYWFTVLHRCLLYRNIRFVFCSYLLQMLPKQIISFLQYSNIEKGSNTVTVESHRSPCRMRSFLIDDCSYFSDRAGSPFVLFFYFCCLRAFSTNLAREYMLLCNICIIDWLRILYAEFFCPRCLYHYELVLYCAVWYFEVYFV
jgi:hypothetical protein